MGNPIIEVKNLSKKFTISHEQQEGYPTLRDSLSRNAKKIFSFPKTLQYNKRIKTEEFWALKNISFQIEKGERVGVIGKNGAGKSTLLKILSRITEPTTGSVKIKGRVASLLEVGTGFHPELTGRENIFLNGAILGMNRPEIKKHFDTIVDFAEIEKFLDTPVKRYSSGMYVRLAFAVAAHLEPEILIVDEVLAVGDAQFQKKCLGKMEEVSQGEGRTVLFVSHNITAVNSLCRTCIYLKNGEINETGEAKKIIDKYLSIESALTSRVEYNKNKPGDQVAICHMARLVDKNNQSVDSIYLNQSIGIEINYEIKQSGYMPLPNIHLHTSKGELIFVSSAPKEERFTKPGKHSVVVWIPENLLNENKYIVSVALSTMSPEIVHFNVKEALIFEVVEDTNNRLNELNGNIPGFIRPILEWKNA